MGSGGSSAEMAVITAGLAESRALRGSGVGRILGGRSVEGSAVRLADAVNGARLVPCSSRMASSGGTARVADRGGWP